MKRSTLISAILVFTSSLTFLQAAPQRELEFNRDVRPILSDKCFHCHGPDAHSREAKLRLDSYEDATREAKAIDPNDLANSEFIARILSADPDEIMPPPKSHRALSKKQIDILTRWVKSGAGYQEHWAFVAPVKAALPEVADKNWNRNPVDRFIYREISAEGLKPMPEAEKSSLLRRISFDLTGLPPTPTEREAFLKDTSPQAYEKVVERLLASPHYGERMALAWMDAARYGDSSVMHADGPRTMWPWRDWVIRSYNNNKPFDEFTIEQLGGDLIPEATIDQQLATGFNRNHATSDEGGAFPEELRVEYIVDRVKTTANVWLGLSMECGQCHDHKFDPISNKEYYEFFAFFNNNKDPGMQSRGGNQAPLIELKDEKREAALAELAKERVALEVKFDQRRKTTSDAIGKWIKEQEANLLLDDAQPPMPKGLVHHIALDDAAGKAFPDGAGGTAGKLSGKWEKADRDGNTAIKFNGKTTVDFSEAGTFAEFDKPFTISAWVNLPKNAGGSIFSRMDVGQKYRGFDMWIQGGNVGTHIIHSWPDNAVKVVAQNKLKPDAWQHVAISYDGAGKAAGVRIYVDGLHEVHNVEQDDLTATIKTSVPFRIGARSSGANIKGAVDELRMYERALSPEEVHRIMDGGNLLKELLATPAVERNEAQQVTLANMYLVEHDEPYQQLAKERAKLSKQEAELNSDKKKLTSMIMADNEKPRMTYVLSRGAYDQPVEDEVIKPGTPKALPPMPEGAEMNRLGLAKWLMQPEHPLTARVTVNRYWAMLFGQGLVTTVMDFGNQGQPPSHPELLDWLAVDFRDSGWDIKRMIKQLVLSQTYRQSSRVTPDSLAADPVNQWLSRGARFRLQGEFIRDNALAVSGLLNAVVGGESVKPYQPLGIWNEVSLNGGLKYKQDEGEKLFRRSMYTYWKRSAPAPNMMIFDAPTREKCVVQRARTNTPLQALVTLNDVHFVEASRKFAERIMSEGGEKFETRIQLAYRLALCRDAAPEEVAICREVFEAQLKSYRADPEAANKMIGLGESPRKEEFDPVELAAYAIIANMILNLDEVLTRG